jgi:hypothetical protein
MIFETVYTESTKCKEQLTVKLQVELQNTVVRKSGQTRDSHLAKQCTVTVSAIQTANVIIFTSMKQ